MYIRLVKKSIKHQLTKNQDVDGRDSREQMCLSSGMKKKPAGNEPNHI
jgi:hypothetical protein